MLGLKEHIEKKLLEYVSEFKKDAPYKNEALYTIIYNLIKQNKLEIDTSLNILKGDIKYTSSLKLNKNKIKVKVSPNYKILELDRYIWDNPTKKLFKGILASILEQGVYLYNVNSRGKLLEMSEIQYWYKLYYSMAFYSYSGLTTLSRLLTKSIDKEHIKFLYNTFELPTLLDKPLQFNKITEDFTDKNISPMENFIKTLSNELKRMMLPVLDGVDSDIDDYNIVKKFIKEYTSFIYFLYYNRDEVIKISDLMELPSVTAIDLKNPTGNDLKIFKDRAALENEKQSIIKTLKETFKNKTQIFRNKSTEKRYSLLRKKLLDVDSKINDLGDKYKGVLQTSIDENINKYGFGGIASPELINECYKHSSNISHMYTDLYKIYHNHKGVYSELYMPTTIWAKTVYYLILGNSENINSGKNLDLIDSSIKGLSELL